MALEIKHNIRLLPQLKLKMTPQLQQAIRLLQLTRLELQQTIRNELEQNPVLEEIVELEDAAQEEKAGEEEEEDVDDFLDSIDMEALFPDNSQLSSTNSKESYNDDGRPVYENTLKMEASLQDHLMTQLSFEDMSHEEKEIGAYLIGNIDENGYLKVDVAETADQFSLDLERTESILKKIQVLDPTGVGARDLRECLMIQGREKFGEKALEFRILTESFDFFVKKDVLSISRMMKVEKSRVKRAMKNLSWLDPKPGRKFSPSDVHYVIPDIFVFKMGNEWVISLNDDGLPKLRINSYYKGLIGRKESLSKEEKEYLRDKVKSAEWFIKSIYQRKQTIYKVMEAIMKHQGEFFDRGPGNLRPLTLRDVADDIEMHESTVSRVTSGKYVHTPHGLFELKYFFSSALTSRNGENVASESVKEKIKVLVQNEDPIKPFSDIEIMRVLKSRGVNIARRTVTKYRESLGILPSNKRKKVF